jgi:hypothetical protein
MAFSYIVLNAFTMIGGIVEQHDTDPERNTTTIVDLPDSTHIAFNMSRATNR